MRNAANELETVAECLQQWASDWLPSIYLAQPLHEWDVDDWREWCETFILRLLRRDGLQVLFRGQTDAQLRRRAERICTQAWPSTSASRLQTSAAFNPPRTAELQQ
eukprot:5398723-Pyramimonas_sp.AAC.1